MKKIKPFIFWKSGKKLTAHYLYINGAGDNLIDTAVFYWSFYDKFIDSESNEEKPQNKIEEGNVTMTGQDYENYESNEYVWTWVSKQLGVTLLPENE